MSTKGMRYVIRDDGRRVYGVNQPRAFIDGIEVGSGQRINVLARDVRGHSVPGFAIHDCIQPWVTIVVLT